MPFNVCRTGGSVPGTMHACPHFERRGQVHACNLEPGEYCQAQRIVMTDEEIRERERVAIPASITQAQNVITSVRTPQTILDESAYESVHLALAIMDKANPMHREQEQIVAYLQDRSALLADAMQLTALQGTISTLAAKVTVDAKRARKAKSNMKARLYINVRRSFEDNIRGGTPTEKYIENIVDTDEDIQEANNAQYDIYEGSLVFNSLVDAIVEHVNMIKRVVSNLDIEWRNEGMQ